MMMRVILFIVCIHLDGKHMTFILLFFLGVILAYLAKPRWVKVFLRDSRILRMLHYELMLLLGMALALATDSQLQVTQANIINLFLCMISVIFSGLFAIVFNNISDIEIDKICNQHRPLIKNEIDIHTYSLFGYAFMIFALFYAALVNAYAVLVFSIAMGNYYLYSVHPFRLKRMTVFSKLVISINSLALIMLGYLLIKNNMQEFPRVVYFIYLIGVTLATNFIDLKDIEGDSAVGIATLPVVIGEKKAKIIIGAAFWLTYISFYYVVKNTSFLLLLILAGGVQFYFINRKPYRELPVLAFYNLSIAILTFALFFMSGGLSR